jgi:hypothetical protein
MPMSRMPFSDDEYEDQDDQQDSNQDDAGEAYSDEPESGGSPIDTSSDDDPAAAVANASPQEVEAHRNMLGDTLQQLSDQGIDVNSLAEKAGISSADVDALSHDDIAQLTSYLSQNHPEVLQSVSERFPAAQGLLSSLTGAGDGGGALGGLLNRFLGR